MSIFYDNEEERVEAWRKLVQLCLITQDWQGEAHALVELATIPNTPFSYIASSINQLIGIFQINNYSIDTDEKEILIRRVIDTVIKRLERGEGTDDDYSNLAWLYMHINDKKNAREIVRNVLTKNPDHYHCLRLAKKLSIQLEAF